MEKIDVAIVGGGPSGMTAGMYAGRATLKTVLFEKMIPGGQVNLTHCIENYPGFESISGAELADKMAKHAQTHGCEIRQEDVLDVSLDPDSEYKIVKTSRSQYMAKVVIIASGGQTRKINIPGEARLNGMGVSYCAICDGAFFRGQHIAVIGGGDAAVEEAIFLTKFGSKVTIIHRRDELRAKKNLQEEAFENEKIEFIWDTVPLEIKGEDKVTSLQLKNVKTGQESELPIGAIFIFIGFTPNSYMVKDLLKLDDEGYILTNEKMQTSVKGIYAVGDIKPNICKQVSVSVGEGTLAAVDCESYINEGHAKGHW